MTTRVTVPRPKRGVVMSIDSRESYAQAVPMDAVGKLTMMHALALRQAGRPYLA